MRIFSASPGRLCLRAVTVAAILVLSACDEDTTAVYPDEQVASIRILIGNYADPSSVDTVTIAADGAVTGNGPRISSSGAPLAAEFLTDSGNLVSLASNMYQLEVEPSNVADLIFTRTGPFSGAFEPQTAADDLLVQLGLLRTLDDEVVFGPFAVLIRW